MKKPICLILCICLVLGASAPAFALPISTNVILDNSKYENYLGGANGTWNYSESTTSNVSYPDTGTWATAMLRQLYAVFKYTKYIDDSLSSNSSYQTSNFGKAMYYFSTASFQNQFDSFDSYLDLISTRVNLVNTTLTAYLPDIKSSISSVASHAGTISSMLGFTASNTLKSNIDSIISGITSSNTNTSNIKSVLDNLYGALGYNSAGTLKTAISSIITNTSPISNIKSNTDYIDDIASDTSSLPTIENNTSAIKINSDYLPGISTYASNLPAIKSNTDYIDDIYNVLSDISTSSLDFNDISWTSIGDISGIKTSNSGDYLSATTYSKDYYIYFQPVYGTNIYKIVTPLRTIYNTLITTPEFEVGYFNNDNFFKSDSSVISYSRDRYSMILYVYVDSHIINSTDLVIHITSSSAYELAYVPDSSIMSVSIVDADNKDFYDVQNWVYNFNFLRYLQEAKDIYFDEDTVNLKNSNQAQENAVVNNFTGSGAASASSADFNNLSSGVSSVKNGLNTGVSLSNLFGIFNNSDGYSWFSSQVLNEINTVQSSTRMRGSSTPLYDQKINEIYSYMGVNNND